LTTAVRDSAADAAKVIEAPTAGGSAWEPRPCEEGWWQTRQSREDLARRLLGLFTDPGVLMDRYVAPWFDRERRLAGLRGVCFTWTSG
jgi:hypothetical protein